MKKIAILLGILLMGALLSILVYRFWPDGQSVKMVDVDASPDLTKGPEGMVWIEGGQFEMGTDAADANSEEKPAHPVKVDGFWMMDHEISNKEFQAFVQATNYVSEAKDTTQKINADDLPAVHISWNDAVSYCAWAGMRLPTEAEWEFAVKGAIQKNATQQISWTGNFSTSAPMPVKSTAPNAYKLYHMAGNVWEWCNDWYDPTYHQPFGKAVVQNNLQGPDKQADSTKLSLKNRVQKGGSFLTGTTDAAFKRPTARRGVDPSMGLPDAGFRPVMTKAMWEAKKLLEGL